MTALDQIFVNLKQWILGFAFWPESVKPFVSILLSITPILSFFPLLFGITTILERKGLARIQNRLGPNRVGLPFTKTRLFGFGQFIADGVKMLTKEDIVPHSADHVVHFLAPVVLAIPVFLAFSVLPFGRNMVAIDLDGGVLFFFAVGAATELSIFMAGWSSSNKYSLLGAMRAIAQMISYEIPLVLSVVPVIMMTGTLSTVAIVEAQTGPIFGFLHPWHVFTPWGLAGFILFLVAAAAESNRTPFDLPEAESELVAGYFTEYSGFKFALFFLGEYLGLFAVSGMAITLFLGGWQAPFTFLDFIPSWLWFVTKLLGFVAFFIWLRGTLPRLRTDQLMSFAWKFMLPMTLINLVVTAVWHISTDIAGGLLVRWLLCAGLVWLPYLLLGRSFQTTISKRTYRYAD
ncbi:MAG TPA: NADH-quinone oxidoreductase subunit NuoH [Candidatus Saccharimonadales bacterium]|nr:NADH-quinone oxidoreductase subunit NuoH [Candidatus Saccharimonadales bacterium]